MARQKDRHKTESEKWQKRIDIRQRVRNGKRKDINQKAEISAKCHKEGGRRLKRDDEGFF